jgi:hypothetical protein
MILKPSVKLASVLLLCLNSSVSFAASDALVTRLLNDSGITRQVGELPGAIKMGMQQGMQQAPGLPVQKQQMMLQSVDANILPADILTVVRSTLKSTLTDEEAEALLQWYESKTGKQVTAAEEQAATPEAYMQMQQQAQQLAADAPRVAYAQKIDKLTGATDMAIELQVQTGLAAYSGMMTVLQPNKPLNIEQYKAQQSAQMTQMRPMMEQMVALAGVYAHRSIEMEKLEQYAGFLSKPVEYK